MKIGDKVKYNGKGCHYPGEYEVTEITKIECKSIPNYRRITAKSTTNTGNIWEIDAAERLINICERLLPNTKVLKEVYSDKI